MAYGKYYVPEDTLETFYHALQWTLSYKKISICERLTYPKFIYFLELDISLCDSVDTERFCNLVAEVLLLKFPNETFIISSNAVITKFGIHVVFPNIQVTSEDAIRLTNETRNCFKNRATYFANIKNIDSMFDIAPYKNGSLRMNWTYKYVRDKTSLVNKGQYVNSIYCPYVYINQGKFDNETLLRLQHDRPFGWRMCRVSLTNGEYRVTKPVSPFANDFGRDANFVEKKLQFMTREVNKSDKNWNWYSNLVKYYMPYYQHAVIWKIIFIAEIGYIFIIGPGSNICANKQEPHGSHKVYFIIKGCQIAQKCMCLCGKKDMRKNGLCRSFEGPWFPKNEYKKYF